MTSVSVAMATYNGARFLREQLDSIAAQTVSPAELVITDDASTDDTLAIVRKFAAAAPFSVRIHTNPERLGYRANFLRAVSLCGSELIALCDQDDVWEPQKLERVLPCFAEADVLLAFHEAWLIDAAGERLDLARIYPLPERSLPSSLFPMKNPYGFSMVFRRTLLAFSDLWKDSVDNLKLDERMAHDQWFFFLASAFGVIAFVEQPLAGYRQHDGNTHGLNAPVHTFVEKIERFANLRSKEYASFAVAADVRASILEHASARLDREWRERASVAAARYRTLARHCGLRAAAYHASGLGRRLSAWSQMLRTGAYSGRTDWSFRRRAALKDLAWLALPRRLLNTLAESNHGGGRLSSGSAAGMDPPPASAPRISS